MSVFCLFSQMNNVFLFSSDSSQFENCPSFQISWTWSDVFRKNDKYFIQQLSTEFTYQDRKDGELSNRAIAGEYSNI